MTITELTSTPIAEVPGKLEAGKRYTLWAYNSFGFPYCQHIKLKGAEIAPYAQYNQSLRLKFVPKRKRNVRGVRFHDTPSGQVRFFIWEGWVDVKADMYTQKSERVVNGQLVGCSRSLRSFSDEYMEIALQSTDALPLVAHF